MTTEHFSRELAAFAANLKITDIPNGVIARTEDLLVDWFGSAVAGHGSRQVETIARFAQAMGPAEGACEVIVSGRQVALTNSTHGHCHVQFLAVPVPAICGEGEGST